MATARWVTAMALAGACCTAVAWWIAGATPWWIPASAVAGAALGGASLPLVRHEPAAWRWPAALAVAMALAAAIVALALGRPGSDRSGAVLTGLAGGAAGLAVGGTFVRSRRFVDQPTSANPLDAVVGRLTRPLPVDEARQQVVDALRLAPGRRAVELWQLIDGHAVLTNCAPPVDREPFAVDASSAATAAAAGVVGETWLRTWLPPLAAGAAADSTRAVPLAVRGDLTGVMVLRRHHDDPPFGPADDEHLTRVARPVAAVLNQHRLTVALEATVAELRVRNTDLQASRQRLVAAADAERRRLERDLHDGAQASLTALVVQVQVIQRLAEQSPERTSELLQQAEADLVAVTTELRHLAHGLVPPLLRTGGLGDAIRGAASRLPLDVRVDAPGTQRFLPQVETAVYFCCIEALQNVMKHAGDGASATVHIECINEYLFFEVTDDGRGPHATAEHGHGLVNMADRIGALGGSVTFSAGAGGCGAVVRGQVPVGSAGGDAAVSAR